jgi:hypothetical protein
LSGAATDERHKRSETGRVSRHFAVAHWSLTRRREQHLGGSDSGVLNCILVQQALKTLPSDTAEAEREVLSRALRAADID